MEYNYSEIERKWKKAWKDAGIYNVELDRAKPKYYVLDMFPYPSGAGLHVGHPLGYVASDIVARYKRHLGYNVLHPMGFDAFGLPAEQYAIQTGKAPQETTAENIAKFKEQLDNLGFSFDWSREVNTSQPEYYKWTQWIFLKLYDSWYDTEAQKARPIIELENLFSKFGSTESTAYSTEEVSKFSAEDWNRFSKKEKQDILMRYRLAYVGESTVNWCPALGTVLANDEVKDGFSERGGHPVFRKRMSQWNLRNTAYAQRLLDGLDKVDFTESLKEMQRNWIGRSEGAQLTFLVKDLPHTISVFTTRIDTIYGVSFLTLAPEHELVNQITSQEQRTEVEAYIEAAARKSELERLSDVKIATGVFTGSFAVHPFSQEPLPIYVGDYVLAGYGTGAVMAVPGHDERDYLFATTFNLPILSVVEPIGEAQPLPFSTKEGRIINSDFLNGLSVQEAQEMAIKKAEELGFGAKKIQFKFRDASFSRQRYWGEPFPIYYKEGTPYPMKEEELPLTLPELEDFSPSEEGKPPLSRAENWTTSEGYPLDQNTMPGYAGSSWYFLRYMDPSNEESFVSREAQDYWKNVDLYVGGTEHATGHILYARFWTKVLFDLGYLSHDEPFQKLMNQGMIQGRSSIAYRKTGTNTFISKGLKEGREVSEMHVPVSFVDQNDRLDIKQFKNWRPDLANATFELEDGQYFCGHQIEKMSKRLYNTVDPNDMVAQYGADAFRMYEMFLGPLEDSKPWITKGIEGIIKFIRKFWRLIHDQEGNIKLSEEEASKDELKIVHTAIKKVTEDIERYSFNTCISAFMVAVNDLTSIKCNKKQALKPLVVLIAPFAPHFAEEMWERLGENPFIVDQPWPRWEETYLAEDSYNYPVSINGKVRAKISFAVDKPKVEIEAEVVNAPDIQKWIEGKAIKKVIVVPKRIVNIVV